MDKTKVSLGHGSGGKLTRDLISDIFTSRLDNSYLRPLGDSAVLPGMANGIAFSTDSFVVNPLFFPGGDIGKLAVAGTVNDLAVQGSIPRFLSLGVILEEGFPLDSLEKIVDSVASEANKAGVSVVTGDTKVVEKGKGDGVFLNTAGVGEMVPGFPSSSAPVEGDAVLLSGSVGDHGAVIMSLQSGIDLRSDLHSDCAVIAHLTTALREANVCVKTMRDPTRGGLAAVLNEWADEAGLCIEADETAIPLKPAVVGIADLLGVDPLQLACEGRMVALVSAADAEKAVHTLRGCPGGAEACMVGRVSKGPAGRVVLVTGFGGRRILDMPLSDPLPRIC